MKTKKGRSVTNKRTLPIAVIKMNIGNVPESLKAIEMCRKNYTPFKLIIEEQKVFPTYVGAINLDQAKQVLIKALDKCEGR